MQAHSSAGDASTKGGGWLWSDSWNAITGAMKGSWQTFAVNVDPNAATPMQEIGVKLYLSGSYAGPIYIDGVEW